MGNWRCINMIGTVDAAEVPALRAAVEYGDHNYEHFNCLSYNPSRPSLFGLEGWIEPNINAIGNLAERDYSVDSVVQTLRQLAKIAPSLKLIVHCGGEYESKECVATIIVEGGEVKRGDPQVKFIMGVTKAQVQGNFLKNMLGTANG